MMMHSIQKLQGDGKNYWLHFSYGNFPLEHETIETERIAINCFMSYKQSLT